MGQINVSADAGLIADIDRVAAAMGKTRPELLRQAMQELVEAHVVYAAIRQRAWPTPAELYVTGATYLRGLSEAATETICFGDTSMYST